MLQPKDCALRRGYGKRAEVARALRTLAGALAPVTVGAIVFAALTAATAAQSSYRTERVVLVVLDGVRYTETLGDTTRALMPRLWSELAPQGIVNHCFFNAGLTRTYPGHAAILTGVYREYTNGATNFFGLKFRPPHPQDPTLFEYYRRATSAPESAVWLVASKFKLGRLDHSSHEEYGEEFEGEQSAGKGFALPGTGNRTDAETWRKTLKVIAREAPRILVVNLADPDRRAHDGDWEGYLRAIREADDRIASLWGMLQQDSNYRDKAALLVTADHGRARNDEEGAFRDHSHGCRGCRHLLFLALGPDFRAGASLHRYRTQIDILPTLSELLAIPTPYARGEVMWELLRPEALPATVARAADTLAAPGASACAP